MTAFKRYLWRLLLSLLALSVAILASCWILLQRSLPLLDGTLASEFVANDVTIHRDGLGIPTIIAANRVDLAFATGFVHSQDRFFQMDLMRRQAAGELSEMFGTLALGEDKRMRFHRFRSRARSVLNNVSRYETDVIESYAAGVNAGLSSLGSKPFEYFLLRETPRAWLAEDSLLVAYAMFLDLNDERAIRDVQRGYAHRVLPEEVFDWLYPDGTRWDAPLTGPSAGYVRTPGPELFRIDDMAATVTGRRGETFVDGNLPGSNNWAVAGSLSRSGRAIVANDMHLGLATPNVFYRVRLVQTGQDARDVSGVSLPGTPAVVTGSNGHVAWAFTNSYGDWSDAVVVRSGSSESTYVSADGEAPFVEYRETIHVKGSSDETLLVRETRWGPLLEDVFWPDGQLAVSWIGHKPDAVNLLHLELETARNIDEAMSVANRLGIPPQNFVCGDEAGNIGWTIAGRIPLRSAYDAGLPADWSASDGWIGWLGEDDYPKLRNPPSGRIWTANARVIDGTFLEKLGDGGYELGARAQQIRDKLFAKDLFDAKDMLAVQLDDRALFLSPWRDLLLTVLDEDAIRGDERRRHYRELVENWLPRASADSVGYRLVRAFRTEVRSTVFDMLMLPVRDAYEQKVGLRMGNQFEAPLWSLVNERPAHLLSNEYKSWEQLLISAVDRNIKHYSENFSGSLDRRNWGEMNTAAIRHPLSRSIGIFARWLDMRREPLDGDTDMPRVLNPTFGASERFGVSPGDEKSGYLHMPAGQSGHPMSDFYRAGHDDWVRGRATPFLPGPPLHTLILGSNKP
ncbi:MAG: penicillin acylase family protein [Gammaproteobacteria bacterium]|nr:penicillin acylase family protein [Gammaproteobacteria bacterium]MDH4315663.1 penicillin acylase family protein [Gammaproteobacteria bacterium]MDH5213591.1 penicillin acylase family protein [Gammaproteobacteria bacterium]